MNNQKKVLKKIFETKEKRPSEEEIYDAVVGEKFWGEEENWLPPDDQSFSWDKNEPQEGDNYNVNGQKFTVDEIKNFEDPVATFRPSTVNILVGNIEGQWLILSWTSDEGFGDFELVWFDSKKEAMNYFNNPKPFMFDLPEER